MAKTEGTLKKFDTRPNLPAINWFQRGTNKHSYHLEGTKLEMHQTISITSRLTGFFSKTKTGNKTVINITEYSYFAQVQGDKSKIKYFVKKLHWNSGFKLEPHNPNKEHMYLMMKNDKEALRLAHAIQVVVDNELRARVEVMH